MRGELMHKLELTVKEILDKQFNVDFKGYSAKEVDEFLDLVISCLLYRLMGQILRSFLQWLRKNHRETERQDGFLFRTTTADTLPLSNIQQFPQ